PLTDLCLYIHELPDFQQGKLLKQEIPANQRFSFQIIIPEVPPLPPNYLGNNLSLTGKLTFIFACAEIESAALTPDSKIIINQIYSSGFDI
ncbi:MAG: hypothetical protein ACYTXY_55350, partial [Nostoc sp.]